MWSCLCYHMFYVFFFFFKQKTAYEMRISDWSSDVCSSDLDEIHQLGLSEVARIKKGMEEIKNQVGFKEPLAKFFDYIRTDPKFKPESAKALGDGSRAIGELVAAAVPKLFSTVPEAPLEIRPEIGRAPCRESMCQDGTS